MAKQNFTNHRACPAWRAGIDLIQPTMLNHVIIAQGSVKQTFVLEWPDYVKKKTDWGPSIISNSNFTISLFLREHREYKLKVHKTQRNKRSDFLQNDKSSLFTAVEGVRESCILFYSTPQLIQKFRWQTESYQINANLHLSLVLRFFGCSSHIVSKIVHVLTTDRGLHPIFFGKGEFRISKELTEIRSWEHGCRNAKRVIPRKFLEFCTRLMVECVSRITEQFKDWYVLREPSL